MATLDDLADRMEAIAAKLDNSISQAASSVALEIVNSLAHNTPVDTSQALSSWLVTLDQPSTIVGTAYYPGDHGSTQQISAAQTVNQALTVLGQKKPGQTIYITNNQPYIALLDAGTHSTQPGNFVARALLVARLAAAKITLNL